MFAAAPGPSRPYRPFGPLFPRPPHKSVPPLTKPFEHCPVYVCLLPPQTAGEPAASPYPPMIHVQNLKKTFGPKVAVNGVSFTVQKGEVLGFLGPNGAGKSTTMRMITGFIPPTAGEVTIGGHSIVDAPLEAKRLIGYLPENAPSYADMTVLGFLSFAAELRGLAGDARKRAVDRVIEMCFLEGVIHQSVETLSK